MAERHEILIARLPGRTGLYLGFDTPNGWVSVARFTRGAKSAQEFVAWAQKAGIRYEDDRGNERGASGLLREEAEEAGLGAGSGQRSDPAGPAPGTG